MSEKLNKEHETAVRETRRKVANAVAEGAAAQAKQASGWRKVAWWVLAAAGAVVAWWYGDGVSQVQPEVAEPPAAEVTIKD